MLTILLVGVGYEPLTYRAVKGHSLGLRSVYNEDIGLSLVKPSNSDVYTTWKARRKVSACFLFLFKHILLSHTIHPYHQKGRRRKRGEEIH